MDSLEFNVFEIYMLIDIDKEYFYLLSFRDIIINASFKHDFQNWQNIYFVERYNDSSVA